VSPVSVRPVPGRAVFATPRDWQAIKLPQTSADAERLTEAVIAAQPGLVSRRAEVERIVTSLVETCKVLDVAGAYVTLVDLQDGQRPATLVASVQPMGGLTVTEVAEGLAGPPGVTGSPGVRVFDLPAGSTARVELLRETGGHEPPASQVVHYVTEIPGADGVMLLTFSTPGLALADSLRQVFHQIACSLHFEEAGQGQ
jgi:hypothetical protein